MRTQEHPATATTTATATEAVEPAKNRARPSLSSPWRWVGIAAVTLPGLAALADLLLSLRRPMSFWGDKAIEEIAVSNALSGHQALGSYSIWGYFHPGPAHFYTSAVTYGLFGRHPVGIMAGVLFVNVACALTVVLVIRRHLGTVASVVAGGVMAAFFASLTPIGVWDHWNPSLVVMPILLATVLSVSACTGSYLALLGAVLVGSFAVQTHLGSTPIVGAALLMGFGGFAWHQLRTRRGAKQNDGSPDGSSTAVQPTPRVSRSWRRPAATVGLVAAIGLTWAPVLAEELTGKPGNVTRIARFLESPPRDVVAMGESGPERHTLLAALRAVAEESVRLPFGWEYDTRMAMPASVEHRPVNLARVAFWLLGMTAASGAACVAWRGKQWYLAALAVSALVTTAGAVVGATRVSGPMLNYYLWGSSVCLLPGWMAAGTLAAEGVLAHSGSGRLRRAVMAALLVGALAPTALFASQLLQLGAVSPEPLGQDALDAASAIEPFLDKSEPLAVQMSSKQTTGEEAAANLGLWATLRRDGYDARGQGGWLPNLAADGTERCVATISQQRPTRLGKKVTLKRTPRGQNVWLSCRGT